MFLPDVAVAEVDDLLNVGLLDLPGTAIAAPLVGAASGLAERQQEPRRVSGGRRLALGTAYGTREGAAVRRVKAPLALADEHPVFLQHVGSQRRSNVHPDVSGRNFLPGMDSNLGPYFDGVPLTRGPDYALGV